MDLVTFGGLGSLNMQYSIIDVPEHRASNQAVFKARFGDCDCATISGKFIDITFDMSGKFCIITITFREMNNPAIVLMVGQKPSIFININESIYYADDIYWIRKLINRKCTPGNISWCILYLAQ